jgi:hypothetical protein
MSQVSKSPQAVRRLSFRWAAGEMIQSLALDIAMDAVGIVLFRRPHVESVGRNNFLPVSLEWYLRASIVTMFLRAV